MHCLPHTFSIHPLMLRIMSQEICRVGFSASLSVPEGSQAGGALMPTDGMTISVKVR